MKATVCGWAWLGALLGLSAILACEKGAQQASEATVDPERVVLARVGDEVVTVEDLGFVPARINASNKLEMLVMRKVAAAEARRRGLAEEPKIREKIAQFRHSALTWEEGLLRNALYNSIRLGLKFSEAEQRAHFERTRNRYTEPQWKLRVSRFASEAEARAAAAELGATGRLDPAQSESLGPVPAGQLPPDLLPVLQQFQQPGDRQLLDLAGGWSLVELETYLPDAPLPFEAVREKVDQDLQAVRAEEVLNAELAKLWTEQVTIDPAAVANMEKQRAELAATLAARRAGNAPAAATPPEPAPAEEAPAEEAPAEAP